MTTGKTIALTRWTFFGKVMSLLFNMLYFYYTIEIILFMLFYILFFEKFFALKKIVLFIYLFLAGLGLFCCMGFSPVVARRGYSFLRYTDFSLQ